MASRRRLVISFAAIAGAFFALGMFMGRSLPRHFDPAPWKHSPYLAQSEVRDAMRRWATKNSYTVEKAMSDRSIEMMVFPDRECVQFQLSRFAVGGVPVYCYRIDRSDTVPRATNQLIYEYSDVD